MSVIMCINGKMVTVERHLYGCVDRAPLRQTVMVQDGWTEDGRRNMVERPDQMSKHSASHSRDVQECYRCRHRKSQDPGGGMISDEKILELAFQHCQHVNLTGDYGASSARMLSFARALLAETTDAARLEGFRLAQKMAEKACTDYAIDRWGIYKGRLPYNGSESGRADNIVQGESNGAEFCAEAIRAMQPPVEWSEPYINSGQLPASNNTDWPHPDGFAGGLMEQQK